MNSDKLNLLEKINSVIKRNGCNKNLKYFDYLVTNESLKDTASSNKKAYFYYSSDHNNESLKKLEQRILSLEEQNEHLLYFIHFLFENFADLVGDIMPIDHHLQNSNHIKITTAEGTVNSNNEISITSREREVLDLLFKGLCAKEIAQELFICETTVITHKKHLKEKFNARNTAELISKAFGALH